MHEAHSAPIVDVRTPAEFEQGHIPGAINLPLFSNEERKIIGTLYKKEGKQPAIRKGLEIVGPKLATLVAEINNIKKNFFPTTSPPSSKDRVGIGSILFHCWRGGMRSSSVAWLAQMAGYASTTLQGGYKTYRNYVLQSFHSSINLKIIGGYTGSGKTIILEELKKQGEQIINLEHLAHHKGSAFGAFGQEKQPTQEQFENNLMCIQTKIIKLEEKFI
mgnify:CR=1 FL=1